jgi:hypothetical protein
MRRLVFLLCATFALSSFLSGAAHVRSHVDDGHHFMSVAHHAGDIDQAYEAQADEHGQPQELDHKDHSAELHFVALDLAPPDGVTGFGLPFVRLSAQPKPYRGPMPLKEPDPERLPA